MEGQVKYNCKESRIHALQEKDDSTSKCFKKRGTEKSCTIRETLVDTRTKRKILYSTLLYQRTTQILCGDICTYYERTQGIICCDQLHRTG